MEVNNFVYGDAKRIFVNTDMGCHAHCQYCYLPSLGIEHGKRRINAHQAIELVKDLEYYRSGEGGSVISIGCYSECMDPDNIADTITLVKYFVNHGNLVQLSTKKQIDRSFFEEIIRCADVDRRLWIYVSLPVITNSHFIEEGTDSPDERIKNFDMCQQYNINSVLYIKPYLEGITDQDIVQYSNLAAQYHIPAVVGEMLSTRQTMQKTIVGEKRLYEYRMKGMDEFIDRLEQSTKVYLHSVDCMKYKGE